MKYIGNIGLILRYFLNEFPFAIRGVYEIHHIQAKDYSNFSRMTLVGRRGGILAAERNASGIVFSAFSAALMPFT